MKKYLTIAETAIIFGVSVCTMRRWDREGKLSPNHRTFGNHRRYSLSKILSIIEPEKNKFRKSVCYSRVSSHDQKDDLVRQAETLRLHTLNLGIDNPIEIQDLGSGLNFKKKGLKRLINLIITSSIDKIFITHKDRLLRFGSDLIINIAKEFGTEVIILNDKKQAFEEELAGDVLQIITVFSARLYGSRSHKNKKLVA